MAGIGFELQKLLTGKSMAHKIFAYLLSALISSGPWLFSMFSLMLINFFSQNMFPGGLFTPFRITIVYIFAASIIISGPIQFLLTRYLADQHYLRRKYNYCPGLFSALMIQLGVNMLTLPLFLFLMEGSHPLFIVGSFLLFVVITGIWMTIDFLSVTKNYIFIVLTFFLGSVMSFVCAIIFPIALETEYAPVFGFLVGQIVLFGILLGYGLFQFPSKLRIKMDFVRYFKEHFSYLFIGGFYNGGIWIDKIMIWIFLGNPEIYNFKSYPVYDGTVFLCYLTIIPALAIFLLRSETTFFTRYHKFYRSFDSDTLRSIEAKRKDLVANLWQGLAILAVVQGGTSLFTGLYLHFTNELTTLFLYLIGAAFFQVLLLFVMIYMMYFDQKREVTIITGIFFFSNLITNYLAAGHAYLPLGAGYLMSAGIAFLSGIILLKLKTQRLTDEILINQIRNQ